MLSALQSRRAIVSCQQMVEALLSLGGVLRFLHQLVDQFPAKEQRHVDARTRSSERRSINRRLLQQGTCRQTH